MVEKEKKTKRQFPKKSRRLTSRTRVIKQKFKVIRNTDLSELEKKVNEFMKGKNREVRGLTFDMSVQPDLDDGGYLAVYVVSIWYLTMNYATKKEMKGKG